MATTSGGRHWRHLDDEWTDGPEAAEAPALACPGCGHELADDDAFDSHRVCGACRRHFPLRARERLGLVVDAASFHETNADTATPTSTADASAPARVDRAADTGGHAALGDAVVTGTARIGGVEAVLVVLDEYLVGAAVGAVVAEKIILAFELAMARAVPVVAVCAGGAAQTRSSPLALVQGARLAASAARLHHAGVPMVAVLTHPTAAGVFSALASQCDMILAEPGGHVGTEPTAWSLGGVGGDRPGTVEALAACGAIDAVVDRVKLRGFLATLLDLLSRRGALRADERVAPRRPPTAVWEAVAATRHPARPDAAAYLHELLDPFVELHGDRVGADDPALVAGIGRLAGRTVAVIARCRGEAVATAAAARKAVRIARLAGHLELPLVALVESPTGKVAGQGLSPELSFATAQLLGLLVVLPVPLVAVAVGEVRDPLAAALMTSDRTLMQDHAVYALGAADGAVTARFGVVGPVGDAGGRSAPALTAWECSRLGLVDAVVAEPEPAAHADPAWAAANLRSEIAGALGELAGVGQRRLLEARGRRLRTLGQSTPAGLAAARRELHDLQEWQSALRRSLGELRERWEQRTFPRPPVSLQRPELSDLAQRLATLRAETGRHRPVRHRREPAGEQRDEGPASRRP